MISDADRRPLILTAKLDETAQTSFDALRQRYFPAHRNLVPAHLSLFQQLPGRNLQQVRADLEEVCSEFAPFAARVDGLRFLGKGVAYTLDSPELRALHRQLSRGWEPFLEAQDLQGLSAHITVQNKVSPHDARRLYEYLDANFAPTVAVVEGVSLWRYLGGPWETVQDFLFSDRYGGPPA